MNKSLIVILTLVCAPWIVLAQVGDPTAPPPQDTGKIQIESSALGEYFVQKETEHQKLSGNVRLRNDSTLIFCDTAVIANDFAVIKGKVAIALSDTAIIYSDSAHYDARNRKSELFGNVVLKNGDQKLFTDRLFYDLDTKVASYHSGAIMDNGKSQLSSQHGYYHTREKMVYFKGDVQVADPEFSMRTDTMTFNTDTRTAYFVAPTRISQVNSKIYCEGGYYDMLNNLAEFDKNAQFIKENQRGRANLMIYNGRTKTYELRGDAQIEENQKLAKADTIQYDGNTADAVLMGNASYKDSLQEVTSDRIKYNNKAKAYSVMGRSRVSNPPNIIIADQIDFNDEVGDGLAIGNVLFSDTAADFTISSARMNYNKKTEYMNAYGGADGRTRPVFSTLIDKDTLYMCSDTLISYKPSSADSTRLLLAYHDVRIFKNNLQASADSLSYSTADSTFRFYGFKSMPILWSDTSQFSADTIFMQLRDEKLHRILLRKNAFVISAESTSLYNQIKGKDCTAFFEQNDIKEMLVEGNAQAVYYAKDEKNAYVGVNETKCSIMRIFFEEKKVDSIKFYKAPDGSFSPLNKSASGGLKLDGFIWEVVRRPQKLEDIY